MGGQPPFDGIAQLSDLPKGMHGGVWRVVHHDTETQTDLNLPIVTSGYSVTEVTLSEILVRIVVLRAWSIGERRTLKGIWWEPVFHGVHHMIL
jgi:hypothetical protein